MNIEPSPLGIFLKERQNFHNLKEVFIQNAEVHIRRHVKSWERKVFLKKFEKISFAVLFPLFFAL